ncbi:winged helix-turn-helix domain-containing protein [Ruegeria sp. 2205SS24-7]|uniref:winged helix-turn-helix domain-containing protein n=1 Tax=Ruegeria discodermiae TaxID=3064389 RepID=UPI002741F5E1|nr:winged helix-turn-helix domain-containing protein [Ruegeria sp. 2205SS24-7]MDP5220587.1 winged helix-turn-helix domain-containing protein [Ruegeria sp. 2205SS24-7]
MTLPTGLIALGEVRYDPDRRAVLGPDDALISLRPQSLDVLHTLASNPGEVVSKDDLIKAVWKDLNVTDDSLTQCIADIRRAIGDNDRSILQTVPKHGYRLQVVDTAVRSRKAAKALPWLMAGMACLAIALFAVWQFRTPPKNDSPLFQTLIAPQVARSGPSIAVLPFESVEANERWIRLGRGLAMDIASELSLTDWLYVTVPESLRNVAGGLPPPSPVLDVRFALGGTIQTAGDEIRISAHLTDATTREILWSETWTEPQDNVFAVQDHIIARIGGSLASTYSGAVAQAELKRVKRKLTDDLDAYEHYLLAYEQLHRWNPDEIADTIAHLEAAVEIDPNFAGALVTLSVAQFVRADYAEGDEAKRWIEASQDSAYRAYDLDPDNPNVLWNLARAYALDGQLDIAGTTLRHAVERAPNNADVLMISAGYSDLAGIPGSESLEWTRRALELNPMAPAWWYSDLGAAAYGAGDYELAAQSMKRAPPMSNARWLITALAQVHLGNFAEAQKAARKFRELAPYLTIEQFAGGSEASRPDQHHMFEAARKLGLPITAEDLRLMNRPAIAVLQLEDLTGDARWQRIGRGISADIANELARSKSLYVTAPDTALNTIAPPAEAGRALNVRYVLDGSLQAEGDDLRVMARLTDAATGAIVWSQRWTRRTDDIFAVQDEIVARIGSTVDNTWSGVLPMSERAVALRRTTDNLDAYHLTLLGVDEKHKFTEKGFANASAYLSQALAIDPDNVPALATLSIVKLFQSHAAASPEQSAALLHESFDLGRKAYVVDPSHPEALLRMSAEQVSSGDPRTAFRYARQAVDAAPNNADILAMAAWISGVMGSESPLPYEWGRRAVALNPNHPDWYRLSLGIAAFFADDLETSLAALRAAKLDVENGIILAAAEALQGNMNAAKTAASAFREAGTFATLSDFWGTDLNSEPLFARLVEGARLAGFPINSRDAQSHKNAKGLGED